MKTTPNHPDEPLQLQDMNLFASLYRSDPDPFLTPDPIRDPINLWPIQTTIEIQTIFKVFFHLFFKPNIVGFFLQKILHPVHFLFA